MKQQEEYDKSMCGLDGCYEALGVIISSDEMENIKNRI